jgi:hypothetical protein
MLAPIYNSSQVPLKRVKCYWVGYKISSEKSIELDSINPDWRDQNNYYEHN